VEFELANEHCQQAFLVLPNPCSDAAIIYEPKPRDAGSTPLGNRAGALGASGLLLGSILGSSGLLPNQTYYMLKPACVLLSVLFGLLLILARFFPRTNMWVITALAVAVLAGVIGQLSTAALLGLDIQHSAVRSASPQASEIALIVVALAVMIAVVAAQCCSLIRNFQAGRAAQRAQSASDTTSRAEA
jgi:hypothetical protein